MGTWPGTTALSRLVASTASSFYLDLASTAQKVMDAWSPDAQAWQTLTGSFFSGSLLLFLFGIVPCLVLSGSSRAVVSYGGSITATALLVSSVALATEGLLAPGCSPPLAVFLPLGVAGLTAVFAWLAVGLGWQSLALGSPVDHLLSAWAWARIMSKASILAWKVLHWKVLHWASLPPPATRHWRCASCSLPVPHPLLAI